jgi:hypothetical protein
MTTVIDNNQRKFLVQSQGFGNTFDIFCNLNTIPEVLKEVATSNSEFKIYEFWNRKLKLCSKKHLNEMFEANQIDFSIGGKQNTPMQLIGTFENYDYYTGFNKNGKQYYNLVPTGQPKPNGGYMSAEYICKIKGITNHF